MKFLQENFLQENFFKINEIHSNIKLIVQIIK